jgi:hypothetical protein
MPMTLEQIEKEAFELNKEDKYRLIQDVRASLNADSLEQTWYDEAERRMKALDEGRTTARDGEKVMEELKAKLTFR